MVQSVLVALVFQERIPAGSKPNGTQARHLGTTAVRVESVVVDAMAARIDVGRVITIGTLRAKSPVKGGVVGFGYWLAVGHVARRFVVADTAKV
jgi:hypothetical protein